MSENKIHICVSQNLIESIIQTIEKHNSNDDEIQITPENIKNYVDFWTSNDINNLMLEYAQSKKIYIAKTLYFIMEIVNNKKRNNLIKVINLDDQISYFEDEYIEKTLKSFKSMDFDTRRSYIDYLYDDWAYVNRDPFVPLDADNQLLIIEWKNYNNFYFYEISKYLTVKDLNIVYNKSNWIIKNTWLIFNKENWEVILNWNILWRISIWTQEFILFEYLYDNKWKHKTHEEIKKHIKKDDAMSGSYQAVSSDIKSRLPEKVKKIIKSWKWWYLIP